MPPVALVPDGLDGWRADAGVARLFGLSRTRVETAADDGRLRLDGAVVGKSARLAAGAMVDLDLPQPRVVGVVPAEVAGMRIVYDDADIVVVDKPPGVAAHPSLGWTGGSVVEHLAAAGFRIATSGPPERQGIVSRLDVGTSGLMVVAKSEVAYTELKRAFRHHDVAKTYRALVQGYPDPAAGTIDAPIGHAKTDEWKMAIDPAGRPAVTHYRTLQGFPRATLLELDLETGRTHQIRVHLAGIRHPCVGDLLYGADPVLAQRLGLERQWLHAAKLSFRHPVSGDLIEFTSGDAPDLAKALAAVGPAE